MEPTIKINGTATRHGNRMRFDVEVNGFDVLISGKAFRHLLWMAVALKTTKDGWINKTEINGRSNQEQGVYLLRQQLQAICPKWSVYESDGMGNVRLTMPKENISLNIATLMEFPDADVRSLIEQYQRKDDHGISKKG